MDHDEGVTWATARLMDQATNGFLGVKGYRFSLTVSYRPNFFNPSVERMKPQFTICLLVQCSRASVAPPALFPCFSIPNFTPH